MSKLDETLYDYQDMGGGGLITHQEARQQIIDLFIELIGENKDPLDKSDATEYVLITGENRLRAELRTKAKSL